MSDTGYEKLIHVLMASPSPRTQAPRLVSEPPPGSVSPVNPNIQGDEEVRREEQEDAIKRRQKEEQDAIKRGQKEEQDAIKRNKALQLTPHEEQFVLAMFSFIKTPRLAGRFINIYRLLRVRANMEDGKFTRFIERDTGEYRAVLVLLAISVRYVDYAPRILKILSKTDLTSLTEWLESECNVEKMIQTDDGMRTKLQDVRSDLRVAKARLLEKDGPAIDDSLGAYQKWAQDVGQYSFYWNHVDNENATLNNLRVPCSRATLLCLEPPLAYTTRWPESPIPG
jgi:hypothetical protein